MFNIYYATRSLTDLSGFTFIELIISISVTSILAAIALPNFSDFMVQLRVDNEIYQLQRMLLVTRNAAINSGQKAIICPLNANLQCTTQWQNELSVFIDINNNKIFDPTDNEVLVTTKPAIKTGDRLLYGKGRNKVTFKPTGQLSGLANGTFRYCPKVHKNRARGIIVARSGRLYLSSDINNDGWEESRTRKQLDCG